MNKTDAIDKLKKDMPLTDFIRGVNKMLNDYWTQSGLTHNEPPLVMVETVGKRYAKLAVFKKDPPFTGTLRAESVYCFYDFNSGALLKGSWKAPVANGIRGNVKDPNVLDQFNWHGPKYLRG